MVPEYTLERFPGLVSQGRRGWALGKDKDKYKLAGEGRVGRWANARGSQTSRFFILPSQWLWCDAAIAFRKHNYAHQICMGVKNSHHLHQFYQSLHLLTSLFSSQYWFCIFQSHKDTSLAAFICQFEALSKVGREALTLSHILNMVFVADVVIVTKNRLA